MHRALASIRSPNFPQLAARRCPTGGPTDKREGLGVWRPLSPHRVETRGAAAHFQKDCD
jgi:hypothetical protein